MMNEQGNAHRPQGHHTGSYNVRGVDITNPAGAIISINTRVSSTGSLTIDHIREVDVMHVDDITNRDYDNKGDANIMNVNNGGSGDDNNGGSGDDNNGGSGGSGGDSSPVVEEDIVFSPLRPSPRSPILNHARYGMTARFLHGP